MLTSEQSIVEFRAGRAMPDRLTQKTHRHYLDYAEQMFCIYRNGIGNQRRSLHRQIEALFGGEPDCPTGRIHAFCKLLDDAGIFATDPSGEAAKLRINLFTKAAPLHPLVELPDRLFEHGQQQVKAQLATEFGTTWGQIERGLYADVMAFQPLEGFEGYPNPAAFLSRYNVAQLQACLYRAESMTVVTTGDFKTILRYAKLARLLHEIERLGPSSYRIIFSGPASVLRESRRYGVNFARFLPALLACKGWTMTAVVPTPWGRNATLDASDRDGFTSHLPSPKEFDSSLEEKFAAKFGPERDGWRLIREGDILHDRQRTFVPDFTFRHHEGTEAFLEIVGFWTPEYLAHRRQTLRQFKRSGLLIAVPEKSLREKASIAENTLVYKTAIRIGPLMRVLESLRTKSGS